MRCPSCAFENPADSRFCFECGGRLSLVCGQCGAELPPGVKFCNRCGKPAAETQSRPEPRSYTPRHLAEKILTSRTALEGERKQVTVLFADVQGSMALAEQVDPEEWHRIMDRFFAILADGVHRFEGTVNQFTGDGIMALFGAPLAHEDHARRACYTALHVTQELRRYAQELRRDHGLNFAVRMGLNSGDVVVGKIGDNLRMDYTAQGHTVGLAARMEDLAEPGKVYLTEATAALVSGYFRLDDLGGFTVKGVHEPVHVFELQGVGALRTPLERSRARGFSRFVGRADEMAALEVALGRAVAGSGQVVGVVADPGLGKSRLSFEFTERCRARGITVYEAHGVSHGKLIAFLPVFELFRAFFRITDEDSEQAARDKIAGRMLLLDESLRDALPLVFDFLSVPDPERPLLPMEPEARQRQLYATVKRLMQARSQREPAVVLLEDLHWFDGGSEGVLEVLVDAARATRTLLVVNFRPEYHSDWMQKSYYQQLPLLPLEPAAIDELLHDLLGADPSLAKLPARIRERTGGNPFFIEETVQGLAETGSLVGTRGAYRAVRSAAELALPATVQAVLGARIDRLGEREKLVLQTAAVIGREFTEPVLRRVSDLPKTELAAVLAKLTSAEFIYEQALYPQAEYAFKHPLTQEAAYRSQLSERRKEIHAAVARAIEASYPDKIAERASELAYHWEGAGERAAAARWHDRAANWVEQRDVREAMRHWRAAYELLPGLPEDRADADLLTHLCQRLVFFGGWSLGQAPEDWKVLVDRGMAAAEHHGDLGARVRLHREYSRTFVTSGRFSEFRENSRETLRLARESGDEDLCALAHVQLAIAEGFVGNLDECDRGLDEFFRSTPSRGGSDFFSTPLPAHIWRGEVLQHRGCMEKAAASFARARELWASADPVGQVLTGAHMLTFGEARGELPGAIGLAASIMKVAEEFGAPNLRAAARGVLVRAYALGGAWQEAARLFEETIALANEHRTWLEWEGRDLASIAHAYVEIGERERAKETAERAIALVKERGSKIQELDNVVALARAEVALGHDDAVDLLLARAESLIGTIGAVAFRPHLAEIRAERARRQGDQAEWRAQLAEAHRLFTETGATGHAARVARILQEHGT
jgi:class 3 adenylate cyclase/tetratricopeptide (TPR) repeat protein